MTHDGVVVAIAVFVVDGVIRPDDIGQLAAPEVLIALQAAFDAGREAGER